VTQAPSLERLLVVETRVKGALKNLIWHLEGCATLLPLRIVGRDDRTFLQVDEVVRYVLHYLEAGLLMQVSPHIVLSLFRRINSLLFARSTFGPSFQAFDFLLCERHFRHMVSTQSLRKLSLQLSVASLVSVCGRAGQQSQRQVLLDSLRRLIRRRIHLFVHVVSLMFV